MVRDGWGACCALYVAMPHLESGGMPIILTGRESDHPPGILTVDIDSPGMLGLHCRPQLGSVASQSVRIRLTSAGRSCWIQWPQPSRMWEETRPGSVAG